MPAYKMIEHCDQEYTLFFEDTGEYYPGWLPVTNASGKSLTTLVSTRCLKP